MASVVIKNWDNKTWLSSQKYINSFNRFLIKNFNLNSNSKILDIGCGRGKILGALNSKLKLKIKPLGIDIIKHKNRDKRINFKRIDALNYSSTDKQKFDLIWVDGAHGYPVACIDLINSIKLLNDDGFILVDDIILSNADNDRMYFSSAGYETLNELKKSLLIDFYLIFKRLDANSNCDKSQIKYIAFVKKRKKGL